jgi:hypothetical protein
MKIPDNATNGDVIKLVFPNLNGKVKEHTVIARTADSLIIFDLQWWNKKYKGGNDDAGIQR